MVKKTFYGIDIIFDKRTITWCTKHKAVYVAPDWFWNGNWNDCWKAYNITLSHNGYPRVKFMGKMRRLSRLIYCAWNKLKWEDIKGYILCHTCDNRACINPHHLIKNTHDYNMNDMVKKGRSAKGEKNGNSKLSDVAREAIRGSDMPEDYLAEIYNVSEQTITRIRNA